MVDHGCALARSASLSGGFEPNGSLLHCAVIHAAPDDYRTDPAGDAGARIACGVIAP